MSNTETGAVMNDKAQTVSAAGSAAAWSNLWQSMAESSNRIIEAWSGSIAAFMMSRVSEKTTGEVNDLSAAIERIAQSPQLATAS
jgi:poly[(R)-3-hydroxyalkanoate] polymerase subunit PhaE